MLIYALSVFVSAYLLFQVQPMIGKYILPWFGGAPAVWSTVLVFFQVLLTGGYAYSNWLVQKLVVRRQVLLHVFLLGASVAALAVTAKSWPSPIMPGPSWIPATVTFPVLRIFLVLGAALGLPYFLLSTNSPLMQAWFSRTFPARSPYWLYALSNAGSLLGLLAYPTLVEPAFALRVQGWLWTGAYVLFAALVVGGAVLFGRAAARVAGPSEVNVESREQPTRYRKMIWLTLSAMASMMLLAVTNALTQDVAAIPFLWVLPLAAYLLSFILAFSGERWYNRNLFALLLLLVSVAVLWTMLDKSAPTILQIGVYVLLLFIVCMICNGELYRLRPPPSHLTSFYLMLSVGGALGGLFVDLVAPVIFTNYWEFYLGLILVWRLVVALYQMRSTSPASEGEQRTSLLMLRIALVLVVAFALFPRLGVYFGIPIVERGFLGVISVRDVNAGDPQQHHFTLSHGVTIHGIQFVASEKRDEPTTYYGPQSGGAIAILSHPAYGHGMRVGLLGEGIGTLATYGQAGDVYRFYEINPAVVDLAEGKGGYFSFLVDSRAQVTTVLGDARLSLERELREGGSQNFDVLVLDTFGSDSIPVHLLTAEAFDVYLQHLAKGGIIAAHISNQHLDLLPVLCTLAEHFHLSLAVIGSHGDGTATYDSQWVLLSKQESSLSNPSIQAHAGSLASCNAKMRLWTDDYSNLLQILK